LVRDRKTEAALAFVQSLRDFSQCLEDLIKDEKISKLAIERMIACFQETYRLEHPQLLESPGRV